MLVAIYKKIACHFFFSCTQEERQAIGFCIPIGTATIFLTSETFRADVEALIFTGISLRELEDVKANTLLCCDVAIDSNVALFPLMRPYFCMRLV